MDSLEFMAGWTARWISTLQTCLRCRGELLLELIILRHQLAVLQRTGTRRPCFRPADRLFWVLLSRWLVDWRRGLMIVQPATVLRWRRQGLRSIWTSSSRGRWRGGRPRIDREIRDLIVRMSRANFLWGAPRVHGELLKLGFDVSQATVSRYMPRRNCLLAKLAHFLRPAFGVGLTGWRSGLAIRSASFSRLLAVSSDGRSPHVRDDLFPHSPRHWHFATWSLVLLARHCWRLHSNLSLVDTFAPPHWIMTDRRPSPYRQGLATTKLRHTRPSSRHPAVLGCGAQPINCSVPKKGPRLLCNTPTIVPARRRHRKAHLTSAAPCIRLWISFRHTAVPY